MMPAPPANETMPMAERFFNTSGPVVPADHYSIPPLERFDLEEILRLVDAKRDFVLHAPRQTGKTSALLVVVFDRDESKPWEEKLYRREESRGGRPVTVWGA